ncbi:insulinase family protein [Magnetococcales bacterium HHB-1]
MTSSFKLLRREEVDALNLTVESYRHQKTGAQHLHLATNDSHNAFLVAFLTVPMDSTGVAHVLEHTALCGSKRYPVRDPFFMMLRRSLSTFMNAFTSSDWTAYPFASQSSKDFHNLLDVYLDAAFFPRLDPLDFAQEGWRVEFSETENPNSPLLYKGVVFNEMKGAMSSPGRILWQKMSHYLFPTTTYHYNSGGDPEWIPDLTWEQLRSFHARHYHPSNAIFMTYGNIVAAEHQQTFEKRVLHQFDALDSPPFVPNEQRMDKPLIVEERYAVESTESLKDKTHIVLGWLLDQSADLETLLKAHLLNGVLLDNSSSPLLRVLETTKLGTSPSPLCGLDDSSREMIFVAGIEGSNPENTAQVEQLILNTLKEVAEKGVDKERVHAVFHQLELSRREVGGDGMPYGLKLMLTALPAALHGGDFVGILALDPVLEKLRHQIDNPDFIPNLIREQLLNNHHRVLLTLKPDDQLAAQKQQAERQRLDAILSAMKEKERQHVIRQTLSLKERQMQEDDPDILPKVGLEDVPEKRFIPEIAQEEQEKHHTTTWYDQPTNGLVYQQVILQMPDLEPELLEVMPLFSASLPEVGCGDQDYLSIQAWQSAISGGIAARTTARSHIDDVQKYQAFFVLSSKALHRNHESLVQLMEHTLERARFDELPRLRELVGQMRAAAEMKITDNGHALAVSSAASGLSPVSQLMESWGGLTGIKRLKKLDNLLNDATGLKQFADKLHAIQERLLKSSRRFLIVGEKERFDHFKTNLTQHWPIKAQPEITPLKLPSTHQQNHIGWATNTNVNFCAKVYPAVSINHADAPALLVLGHFLRNGYLHWAIREQGGAYGAMAGFDSDSGAFRLFSYRDPRIQGTLEDFDHVAEWLQSNPHESRTLEEAILGVVSSIDKPASPAGEARQAYHDRLHGRSSQFRQNLRQKILKITIEDLKEIGTRYLQPEKASVAIVSNRENLQPLESSLDLRIL